MSTYEIAEELGCSRRTVSNWLERFEIARRGRQPDPCPLRDRDLLIELYVQQGLSLSETAAEAETTIWKVRYWMGRHGIEARDDGGRHFATTELTNSDWLRTEYVEKEQPTTEIAERLDCAPRTVSYWLGEHGIESRRALSEEVRDVIDDPEQLRELYEDREMTAKEIAERLEVSAQVVGYRLRKFEITSSEMSGENHPRWNGGEYAYGSGWTENKRAAVRERDGFQCRGCGMNNDAHRETYENQLHVHHIRKARNVDDPEVRNAMRNLISLCVACHSEAERLAPDLPSDIEPPTDE